MRGKVSPAEVRTLWPHPRTTNPRVLNRRALWHASLTGAPVPMASMADVSAWAQPMALVTLPRLQTIQTAGDWLVKRPLWGDLAHVCGRLLVLCFFAQAFLTRISTNPRRCHLVQSPSLRTAHA